MSGTVILTIASYFIAGVILIIVTLSLFKKHKKEKFVAELNNLERDKNLIISASILSELNKVENLINKEALRKV
jgi:septation ring formation regulator EzrA